MGKLTVYKLVRRGHDGKCHPLFIDSGTTFEFGKRMHCKYVPTKGFAPRSVDGGQTGGWHCCFVPVAPHLSELKKDGERRVWIECEGDGKTKTYKRPFSQGGEWILVETITPIREVPWEEVRKMQRKFMLDNRIVNVYVGYYNAIVTDKTLERPYTRLKTVSIDSYGGILGLETFIGGAYPAANVLYDKDLKKTIESLGGTTNPDELLWTSFDDIEKD